MKDQELEGKDDEDVKEDKNDNDEKDDGPMQEVPQIIKDKITDIEQEQQEKLRQTMLKQVTAPKTSALKNLEEMFADYPVVTSETSTLKLDVIGELEENDELVEGLNHQQQLFSRLMTSINPFS